MLLFYAKLFWFFTCDGHSIIPNQRCRTILYIRQMPYFLDFAYKMPYNTPCLINALFPIFVKK